MMQLLKRLADRIAEGFRACDGYFCQAGANGREQPRLWCVPHVLLLLFLIFGPCPRLEGLRWRSWYFLSFVLAALVGLAWLVDWKVRSTKRLFVVQFSTVCVLFAIGFAWPLLNGHLNAESPRYRELDRLFYPHLWHPFAVVVFLSASLSRWLVSLRLRGMHQRYRTAGIRLDELVTQSRLYEPLPAGPMPSVWTMLFNALSSPVELVLLPSLWLVFASGEWSPLKDQYFPFVYWSVAAVLFVSGLVVLGAAETNPRLSALVTAVRRTFLYNGAWLTSIAAIGLAVAWVCDFAYVSTVMQGDRWLVVWYLLALYSLFASYNYWTNRWLTVELLTLFDPSDSLPPGLTVRPMGLSDVAGAEPMPAVRFFRQSEACVELNRPAPPKDLPALAARPAEAIPPVSVRLSIHGAARFSVSRSDDRNLWQSYERSVLIEKLQELLPSGLQNAGTALLTELRVRMRSYHAILNVMIFAAVGGLMWIALHQERVAILQASGFDQLSDTDRARLRPVRDLLFSAANGAQRDNAPQRRTVLLVAASGGGSRAALYTASVLHGLHRQGHLDQVTLVSGVSGGGAALAYFVAHRDELLSAPKGDGQGQGADPDNPWKLFHDRMAYAYIADVLRGACEPRVLWQTSIATLLAESFEAEFQLDQADQLIKRLGDCQIGVIFNTTFVGQSPPEIHSGNFPPERIRRAPFASGLHAGSRVILTNLADAAAFPAEGFADQPHEILRYVVLQDPNIPLAKAAALNANFPPVFPNAAIDVGFRTGPRRYWVTDGGAEENKGEISLLLALRHAIQAQADSADPVVLPNIHVLVVEASAGSLEYHHDQGIAAASGAASRLANQLGFELQRQIQEMYAALAQGSLKPHQAFRDAGPRRQPQLQVHFLPMPSVLRIDSGLGTHWMLPNTVRLVPTQVPGERGWFPTSVQLGRREVEQLVRQLHARRSGGVDRSQAPDALKQVRQWIKDDPLSKHPVRWKAVCDALDAN